MTGARVTRAAAACALALVTTVMAGCASGDPQVWSGPPLPGVSGDAPDGLPDGVDGRVVNGIAWVSSTSAQDSTWLRHRIDLLEAGELRPCLAEAGLSPDLLLRAAESRESRAARTVTPQFPDARRVGRVGLWPEPGPEPERLWTASERETVERCRRRHEAAPSGRARAAGDDLRRAFEDLVHGRPDPLLAQANAQFASCMEDRGYPADDVGTPDAFLSWAARHRRQDDPNGRRMGADYVTCGTPVWRSQERARASVRLAFVDSRTADLRLLTSLVS